MARYFMHLRDGTEELLDPEGRDFPTLSALRDAVLFAARHLLMGDVRDGLLDLRFRIDAEDDTGTIIYTLPFSHAVNTIPGGPVLPVTAAA
jgi:hypothetical protein